MFLFIYFFTSNSSRLFSLTNVFILTRATASMFLERQINTVDNSVSGFEEQLAEDAAIPDVPNVLQTRIQKLQVTVFQSYDHLKFITHHVIMMDSYKLQ